MDLGLATVIGSAISIVGGAILAQGRATNRAVNNGSSAIKVLEEIRRFQNYQHTRNHDVMNIATAEVILLYEIGRAIGVELPELETLTQFADWKRRQDDVRRGVVDPVDPQS